MTSLVCDDCCVEMLLFDVESSIFCTKLALSVIRWGMVWATVIYVEMASRIHNSVSNIEKTWKEIAWVCYNYLPKEVWTEKLELQRSYAGENPSWERRVYLQSALRRVYTCKNITGLNNIVDSTTPEQHWYHAWTRLLNQQYCSSIWRNKLFIPVDPTFMAGGTW